MEMKYYNASNNFKAPIPREPKPYRPPQKQMPEPVFVPPVTDEPWEHRDEKKASLPECPCEEPVSVVESKPALSFDKDDYLLLGLILILLMNGCDDYLLLIVLGYLLIDGKKSGLNG